ncbi:MAG: histidine kinase [Planctomycetes bacterium]|nr:histidine kinase [Planctomycetota bacterium]
MTPFEAERGLPEVEDRLQRFQDLTPRRVRRLLLVGSPYDSFLLEEEGRLQDLLHSGFLDSGLRDAPRLNRISSGSEALALLSRLRRRFDLVVATPHLRDLEVLEFARRLKEAGVRVPVVVLAFDARELAELRARGDLSAIERLYVWQGDYRLLLAIVNSLEDRWNVRADTERVGVSSILLIEDSVRYYSSFLPRLYAELVRQSRRVITEGTNPGNQLMRLRARPKVLHCRSYEEAIEDFRRYRATLLGILSDVDFPRDGRPHAASGLEFAEEVRREAPDLPILLQTRDPAYAQRARAQGVSALLKDSPFLLEELSRFMRESFGFGDFVFRRPSGEEVGRARDLRELEALLRTVPDDSLVYHGERNEFSTWLRARTEFALAEALRPPRVADFPDVGAVRAHLLGAIREFRRERQAFVVSVFDADAFEPETSLAKVGGGSLGGKARGLAFVRRLLRDARLRARFPGVRVFAPSAVVLATEVFEEFLERDGLRDFAMDCGEDARIELAFLDAPLPEGVVADLGRFLALCEGPLAVRSSSLLEDSPHLPLTGLYRTEMVPNLHPDGGERLRRCLRAIRLVYASIFLQRAKAYLKATPYRLEEERMAVLVQRLVGARHGPRFYPDFAGVARSYNFYATAPMTGADGIVSVALGLGETVVEGGKAVRFAPRFPRHPIGHGSPEEILRNSQTDFFALDVGDPDGEEGGSRVRRHPIEVALEDGTLAAVGSTYSAENDAVYDGLGRPGVPVVTFAPVLKHGLFPLAEIARDLLDLGSRGLNRPVEIEFAVNLSTPPEAPREFALLQIRPFAARPEAQAVPIGRWRDGDLLCRSRRVLGNGRIEGIRDVVVVDRERFDRSRSREVAEEVARMNQRLVEEEVPYLLVGVGRWGAADPWLGIPVAWEQIAGARAIVEAPFKDFDVVPSQGSHFFQNLAASLVGYFTVGADARQGFVDWAWLAAQPAAEEGAFVRRLRLDRPLTVLMDGREGSGVVVKGRG